MIQTVNFKLILYDTLMFNLIISLTQEAEQADEAHVVENGTHAEETNAEENPDDSIVMPSILSFPPHHAVFLFPPFPFHPV